MEKNRTRYKALYILIIIGLIIIPAIIFTVVDSKNIERLHKEFKTIENSDLVKGEIVEIYTAKGASFLTFKNGKKLFIPTSKNYLYEKKYLDQNLQVGDSLIKTSKSDTILIKNKEIERYFVIGKFINESENEK